MGRFIKHPIPPEAALTQRALSIATNEDSDGRGGDTSLEPLRARLNDLDRWPLVTEQTNVFECVF
jgi:hypothetical protein